MAIGSASIAGGAAKRQALHRGPVEPLPRQSTRQASGWSSAVAASRPQHRQPDQKPIRSRALPHAERDRERVALRPRQLVPAGRASARTTGAARRTPAPFSGLPPPRARTTRKPRRPGRPHSPATARLPDPGLRRGNDQPRRCYPRAGLIQHPIQQPPAPVAIQQPGSTTTFRTCSLLALTLPLNWQLAADRDQRRPTGMKTTAGQGRLRFAAPAPGPPMPAGQVRPATALNHGPPLRARVTARRPGDLAAPGGGRAPLPASSGLFRDVNRERVGAGWRRLGGERGGFCACFCSGLRGVVRDDKP